MTNLVIFSQTHPPDSQGIFLLSCHFFKRESQEIPFFTLKNNTGVTTFFLSRFQYFHCNQLISFI